MESEKLKNVVKWLSEEIEDAKKELDSAKKDRAEFGKYEDCGDSYESMVVVAEANLRTLVRVKINAERMLNS